MALRFRKRIRIAPGISVNITSKGITSATIGTRGASVNLGKKGAYLNAGIPGTGVYVRERISGPKNKKAVKFVATSESLPRSKNTWLWWTVTAVIVVIVISTK